MRSVERGVRATSGIEAVAGAGDRVIAIVGNYGSGKTELAVNLSLQLAAGGRQVHIADLDLVNPYFRCREARMLMEDQGIRVVVPPGAQIFADLPIILPEIRGMLHPPAAAVSILDVGGDDVGARALASFRTGIADGEYELWQVINARRPFTDSVAGCVAMRQSIESASRWKVTGLVVNTHLMDDTTPEVVLEGWRLAAAVRAETGLPIRALAVMAHLADRLDLREIDAPILRMQRHMLPPWLRDLSTSTLAARRPTPLGVPPRITLQQKEHAHGSHQY